MKNILQEVAQIKRKTLSITAKCSDMFSASLSEGPSILQYDGYVPTWFPNPNEKHYGDYVELKIDVETGQILNWKKPTQAQLNETFKKELPENPLTDFNLSIHS